MSRLESKDTSSITLLFLNSGCEAAEKHLHSCLDSAWTNTSTQWWGESRTRRLIPGAAPIIVTETWCCELLWQFEFWQMKWKLHLLKWQSDTQTVFSSIVADGNTVGHFGSGLKSLEAEAGTCVTDWGVSITAADRKYCSPDTPPVRVFYFGTDLIADINMPRFMESVSAGD